ncbi:hypothetical protein SEA_DELAGARZA_55 [Microbacterium phage DelaGarza]|nr:hypothetical protein SEA_DELAGARZA_55 [Microbacterium phage DelaGarza]
MAVKHPAHRGMSSGAVVAVRYHAIRPHMLMRTDGTPMRGEDSRSA